MREIKFRGKRVDNGKWVYGGLFINSNIAFIIEEIFMNEVVTAEVIPETVGQFTGLKDKNGKEIYEGDICLIDDIQFDEDELFKIEWDDEMATFTLSSEAITVTFDVIYAKQLEIVYNIHDNPELLEVSNA